MNPLISLISSALIIATTFERIETIVSCSNSTSKLLKSVLDKSTLSISSRTASMIPTNPLSSMLKLNTFSMIFTNSSACSREIGALESTKISRICESITFCRILEIVSISSAISWFSIEGMSMLSKIVLAMPVSEPVNSVTANLITSGRIVNSLIVFTIDGYTFIVS